MRLSKDREQEIRKCSSGECKLEHEWATTTILDLLAEIDALRESGTQKHFISLRKEIDALRAELNDVHEENEFLETALAGRRDEHHKHLDDKMKLKAENQKLLDRIETLRATLIRIEDVTPSIGRPSLRDWELRQMARERISADDEASK